MSTYTCYHCGKQIKGTAQLVVPPLYVQHILGTGTKAYHPSCYAKAEAEAAAELNPPRTTAAQRKLAAERERHAARHEEFRLTQQPATLPARERYASTKATQRVLLTGLDCLAGQADLFEVDGEPEPLKRFEAGGASFRIDF